ncbi:MAG: phage virion morphogenesis protein [Prevotellaceae bacterium]|jgi:phage gpG-like protein|nr:phage virion morphogenesis protein [Prevotellaceae bacterium]
MTGDEFIKRLQQAQRELENCISRVLPVKVGALAKAHFQDNFRKSGFVNNGLHAWKPAKRLLVKNIPRRRSKGKLVQRRRKPASMQYKTLLSDKNHLRDSIYYTPIRAGVRIYNPVEYAAVHNEGLRAGRGKGFRMPKRQFMGESAELNKTVQQTVEKELSRILNLKS